MSSTDILECCVCRQETPWNQALAPAALPLNAALVELMERLLAEVRFVICDDYTRWLTSVSVSGLYQQEAEAYDRDTSARKPANRIETIPALLARTVWCGICTKVPANCSNVLWRSAFS